MLQGRGFCPSCLGRRLNATAVDLVERVVPPQSGLRQWVLTFRWVHVHAATRAGAQDAAGGRRYCATHC
ncbi:MAG TPA: hypothetical protein VIZ31_11535, partial [Vicinamibacteria bacterium]